MKKTRIHHGDTENTENTEKRKPLLLFFSVLSVSLWFNSSSAFEPPVVGRPAEFSGAIGGPFVVTASIEPSELAVEQPATLTVRLVGPGNLRDLPRPALDKLPAFQPFAVDPLDDEFQDGSPPSRVFRYRLRPRTAGIREVPRIRFVYFNPAIMPASRGYQTTYTSPLPLTVRESPSLSNPLPARIAGLHRDLALNPSDSTLYAVLEDARDRVAYPSPDWRPHDGAWPPWLAWPNMAWLTVGSILVSLGLLRRAMATRRRGWLAVAMAGMFLGSLPVVGAALAWRERARNEETPVVVLSRDTELRRGNGDAYPPRLAAPLPAGAEVRRLFERQGWLQVELVNGVVGWVPVQTIVTPR